MQLLSGKTFSLAALLCCGLSSYGAVVYNEAVNGDLSNDGLAPTTIALAAGSNQIFGTTGRTTAMDRDYFRFTIPVGLYLSSLSVIPGTTVGGATSFIGLQAGPQLTLPVTATTATGLLGWWHYAATDGDILPSMGIPANGSIGFSNIGAGTYSIWIQDFNAGTFNYGFDLTLSPTPEPSALCAAGVAMLGGLLLIRRRGARTVC